jgi:ribulose-5-phosphate 4-epimerase/fuculose-1-phosphate aldolase
MIQLCTHVSYMLQLYTMVVYTAVHSSMYTAVLNLVVLVVHTHSASSHMLSCRPAWMLEDFNLEDFRFLLQL